MLNTIKIEEILRKMSGSPLFHLFGASKELFHSNFIYWLSTLNRVEFLKLFAINVSHPEEYLIEREKRILNGVYKATLDFYLSYNDQPMIIIENKVKDFPTEEQLTRIREAESSKNCRFILLSLFYIDTMIFPGWEVLTYKELSLKIKPENFTHNQYYQSLIDDYVHFISNLSFFAEALSFNESYDFAIAYEKSGFELLNDYNFWESYQKARGQHLLHLFNNRNDNQRIETNFSINHQKATMDFFIRINDYCSLGVQLENNQYRRFILSRNNNAREIIEALYEKDLFITKDFHDGNTLRYNSYGRVFKYVYQKMDEPVKYPLLFHAIKEDLKNEVLANETSISHLIEKISS